MFTAKYSGYPEPMLIWQDTNGNQIPRSKKGDESDKFEAILDHQSQQTALKIKKPLIVDSGYYTLWADNGHVQKEHKFHLLVKDKPLIGLSDVFFNVGGNVSLTCEIFGYPSSNVAWSLIPCERVDFDVSCDESKTTSFNIQNGKVKTVQKTSIKQVSTLSFRPSGLGVAVCEASNTEGTSQAKANVIPNNPMSEDFAISTKNQQLPITVGDEVSVTCAASTFKYDAIDWYKDDIQVRSSMIVRVISNSTSYYHRKEIRWDSVSKEASGKYTCRANVIKSENFSNRSWELDVMDTEMPEIIVSNIEPGTELEFPLGEPVKLLCKFNGIPHPKITWYKDEKQITTDANSSRISMHENNSILAIHLNELDEGIYKCVAENRAGLVSRETKLKVTNIPTVSKALIFGIIVAICVLLICIFLLYKRFRRERWQVRELRAKRLANMDIGNTENVYHDIGPLRPMPNNK